MSDFYVTLPSNVPNGPYPNTSSRYVTRLPEVLQLRRDEWVVALTDLVYSHSFVNVGRPLYYWIHFKSERRPLRIALPSAQYGSLTQIIDTLNNSKPPVAGEPMKRKAVDDMLMRKRRKAEEEEDDTAEDLIPHLSEDDEEETTPAPITTTQAPPTTTHAPPITTTQASAPTEDEDDTAEDLAEHVPDDEEEEETAPMPPTTTTLSPPVVSQPSTTYVAITTTAAPEAAVTRPPENVRPGESRPEEEEEDTAEDLITEEDKEQEEQEEKETGQEKKDEETGQEKEQEERKEQEEEKKEEQEEEEEDSAHDLIPHLPNDTQVTVTPGPPVVQVTPAQTEEEAILDVLNAEAEVEESFPEYRRILEQIMDRPRDEAVYRELLQSLEAHRSIVSIDKSSRDVAEYIKFQKEDDRISVAFVSEDVLFIEFEKACSYFLGFDDIIVRDSTPAPHLVDLFGDVSVIYLYSDLVDPIIVGNIKSNLLSVVPCTGEYGRVIYYTVPSPRYVPLMNSTIDSIRIELLTDAGRPIPFSWGTTIAVLHFKKK